MNYFKKENCRVCLSTDLKKVIELTPTPPGNNFLDKDSVGEKEYKFPLELDFCETCHHIQLGHVVDPSYLFQNSYSYVSATSPVFVKHLSEFAHYVIGLFELDSSSMVIDIGSNDGTFLSFFKEKDINVLGVDPATDIAEIAMSNGINTIPDFFNYELANKILDENGLADIITSHNACAHIDDLDGVIAGVGVLLKEDGVFIMEVGYFVDVFQNTWFDTIYHEHLDFHTVKPLEQLFKRFNLELFRVERISPQGGSIRVFIQRKNGPYKKDNTISELILLEQELGLDNPQTLFNFEKKINSIRDEFKVLIKSIKDSDKSIAGFGAPTKATTLGYHFNIGINEIDFIVDDNPLKQGLLTPGKHIPVFSNEEIYKVQPDYLLILAWNFAESIMKKHKDYSDNGGRFILPMPKPRIVK